MSRSDGLIFKNIQTALDYLQSDSCVKCGIPFSAISKQVTSKIFNISLDLGGKCPECQAYYCPACGTADSQCQRLVRKIKITGEEVTVRCSGTIKIVYIKR